MIDTTIQFNGHNSYKVTELLLAYPFGVQGMSYITHSFQAYCTSMLASATRAKTKFFDGTGATLSEVSHAFAVPAVFEKIEITVPVPATAVQAQLVFLHGGTDWWFAEPKSEEGQTATPYNVNYAGPLTHITPNGLYTGMVTANQIVVTGSIAQPDETLETRLVTINNGVINLSSTLSAKTTKLTNEGVYTGEVVATQVTTGTLKSANNYSWINLDDGKFSFGNGALTWSGSALNVTGNVVATSGNVGGLVVGTNDLTITVSKVFGPFNQSDLDHVMDIVMRVIAPTQEDYDKYDFFGSGRLTALNSTVISRMINGTHGWTNPDTITYQVVFSTSGTNNLITLKNDKSTETTVIRPASVETSHGRYATLEATNIDAMAFGSNGNVGQTGSFKAKNASGNEITVTVTGGLITSIG